MPKVSIIILNWNGEKYLRRCLESVINSSYPSKEILVVDNASSDDSITIIREFPEIRLIQNPTNLGFAQGNNLGYQHSTGDYIYFLNNDTYVEPDFLEPLVKAFESDQDLGGVQSKIYLPNEDNRLDNVGGYLTWTGFLYHYGFRKLDGSKYQRELEIFSAKGAGMCFKREVIEKVGLFDEDFWAYFEETDFCWRVWLAGYKIKFMPESKIYHLLAASFRTVPAHSVVFHNYKNRLCSLTKNLSAPYLLIILPLQLAFLNLISCIYFLRLNFRQSAAVQLAIFWNILHLPATLVKRTFIQTKIRQTSDRNLFIRIMRNPRLLYYWHLLNDQVGDYEDSRPEGSSGLVDKFL